MRNSADTPFSLMVGGESFGWAAIHRAGRFVTELSEDEEFRKYFILAHRGWRVIRLRGHDECRRSHIKKEPRERREGWPNTPSEAASVNLGGFAFRARWKLCTLTETVLQCQHPMSSLRAHALRLASPGSAHVEAVQACAEGCPRRRRTEPGKILMMCQS